MPVMSKIQGRAAKGNLSAKHSVSQSEEETALL